MKKLKTIILSIMGGIDVAVYLFTPIILGAIWINLFGIEDWTSYLLISLGFVATLFRAIKIGFLKR
jgi:hypothetical protein